VGSTDGKLYELSLADGHVRATRTIGYTVGDPVVDRFNNRLFVHAGDGYLYSFSIPF
jgi:outer membrane protein assembly factor BamB